MTDDREMPSELRLEQLALDEAPRAVVERLGDRLQDGDVRERIDALRVGNAAILAEHPPAAALSIVRARVQAAKESAGSPKRGWWWATLPVLAGSAAVLAVMVRAPGEIDELGRIDPVVDGGGGVRVVPDEPVPREATPREPTPGEATPGEATPGAPLPAKATAEDGVRLKGHRAHLVIHRREQDGPVRLDEHTDVHATDLLQLGYVAAGRPHGVIVSIDGAGAVTLHWPDAVDDSSALEQDEVVALAHAYELDDAPAFERFVLVTADEPIDAAVVVHAAERLAESPKRARTRRLPVPTSWQQSSILLRKVEP